MLVAGLDEAGRGPVLGPLVIGCALIEESNLYLLEQIGVDDSKQLSSKKREKLAQEIKLVCSHFQTLVITPQEIVQWHDVDKLTLNQIEEKSFALLLNNLPTKPEIIYLDACDTKEERFGISISKLLHFKPNKIISKHKGDSLFKIVGAASILAKTHRDAIIESYKTQYGEIGSGYPSDPKTKRFLDEIYAVKKEFPPIVRTWWKTAQNIQEKYCEKKKTQTKLTDF